MTSRQRGYLLTELLVYFGLVMLIMSLGTIMVFRCIDNSVALRRSADDIAAALHAGERWRTDIRAARDQILLESGPGGQSLLLPGAQGAVTYRFDANSVCRRVDDGPWVCLLPNVRTSKMERDRRQNVTAWRWELELQPQAKGTVKPGRTRPLFTFLAVPES